jgi:hypothetical protein
LTAHKKSRSPSPLRDASGRLIATFSDKLITKLIDEYGAEIADAPFVDVNELISTFPYRSWRLRRVPGVIGAIWIVPSDNPIPPLPVMQQMGQIVAGGLGLLLLANDAAARHECRAFIERMLAGAGADAIADEIERQRSRGPSS